MFNKIRTRHLGVTTIIIIVTALLVAELWSYSCFKQFI